MQHSLRHFDCFRTPPTFHALQFHFFHCEAQKIKMNSVFGCTRWVNRIAHFALCFCACFYGCSKSMKNLIAQSVFGAGRTHLCYLCCVIAVAFAWYYSFLPLLFLMMSFCWCCHRRCCCCCHWLTIQPLLLLFSSVGYYYCYYGYYLVWCFHRQRLDFVSECVCAALLLLLQMKENNFLGRK